MVFHFYNDRRMGQSPQKQWHILAFEKENKEQCKVSGEWITDIIIQSFKGVQHDWFQKEKKKQFDNFLYLKVFFFVFGQNPLDGF